MEFVKRVSRERGVDFEAWESALVEGVLKAGAGVLERLLEGIGRGDVSPASSCVPAAPGWRKHGAEAKAREDNPRAASLASLAVWQTITFRRSRNQISLQGQSGVAGPRGRFSFPFGPAT